MAKKKDQTTPAEEFFAGQSLDTPIMGSMGTPLAEQEGMRPSIPRTEFDDRDIFGRMDGEAFDAYRKRLERDYQEGRITRDQFIQYMRGTEVIGPDQPQIPVGETPRGVGASAGAQLPPRDDAAMSDLAVRFGDQYKSVTDAAPAPDDPYSGMSRGERDIAILTEMEPTQEEIDAAVAEEEGRVARRTQGARILRDEDRRLQMDPTIRVGEGGRTEGYPDEVEAWMDRNASQYDMEMRAKYPQGDVPFDSEAEADARLYAAGQRQQREHLRGIAVGSGLKGRAATEFEYWKQSGGRWPGAYTSMSREAIRAAQQYYLQFGRPRGTQVAAPTNMTMEEFERRQAAGEFDTPLSIPGTEGGEARTVEDRAKATKEAGSDRLYAIAEREAKQRGMSVSDLLGPQGATPENLRRWYRSRSRVSREESGRAAAVRAIMRRDPGKRKAQLERVNANLPPAMRISPSEVGLPERQSVGSIRDVESVSDLSMQTAIEGEYVRAPQGTFRIAEAPDGSGLARVPVQKVSGRLVPDADKMSLEDFASLQSGTERRTVGQLIMSGGNTDYAEKQRNIRRDRARISGSDDYTEAEKAQALTALAREESRLHFEFLRESIPGDPTDAELSMIPEMTQRERLREEQIEATRRRNQEDPEGGFGKFGTDTADQPAQQVVASPVSVESPLIKAYKAKIEYLRDAMLTKGATPDEAKQDLSIFINNNWGELSKTGLFEATPKQSVDEIFRPDGPFRDVLGDVQ